MSNIEYLNRFRNLSDVVSAMGSALYNDCISAMVSKRIYGYSNPRDERLNGIDQAYIQDEAEESYLAVAFIKNADKGQYIALQEQLKNSYILGDLDVYPFDFPHALTMLNEYHNSRGGYSVSQHHGFGFAQE